MGKPFSSDSVKANSKFSLFFKDHFKHPHYKLLLFLIKSHSYLLKVLQLTNFQSKKAKTNKLDTQIKKYLLENVKKIAKVKIKIQKAKKNNYSRQKT